MCSDDRPHAGAPRRRRLFLRQPQPTGNCTHPDPATRPDCPGAIAFLAKFQDALKRNDHPAVAALVHYPLLVTEGGKKAGPLARRTARQVRCHLHRAGPRRDPQRDRRRRLGQPERLHDRTRRHLVRRHHSPQRASQPFRAGRLEEVSLQSHHREPRILPELHPLSAHLALRIGDILSLNATFPRYHLSPWLASPHPLAVGLSPQSRLP